nr:Xaa-Pro peptidase family protein [Texcoconibacillus texcoconensis]
MRETFQDASIDGILVASSTNRRYLSKFTGTAGVVLISENEAKLITDFRYTDQAEEQAVGFEIVEHSGPIVDEVANQIEQLGLKKVGFEKDHLTYAQYETYREKVNTNLVPVSGLVEKLRMVKDEQEIQTLQEAVDIADETFNHIQSFIRPGVKEIDVANEIEFFMRKQGAVSSSFDIIVASGYRSALPHGVASEKTIQHGELVTLDFGAYYKGYCSDITRTVAVGEPSEELKAIYNTVYEAQKLAMNQIKAGLTGKEADKIARDYITERGYGKYFGHSTGHGLGMEVHEGPGVSHRSNVTLKPGMVVTVEPGIYISGVGGTRIEDDTVIAENGNRSLSKSTKELLILGE